MPDARVRLLKVVTTLMCGGTEQQFMSLSRSLDSSRFALEFACLRKSGGFVTELEARRIPLRGWPHQHSASAGVLPDHDELRCSRPSEQHCHSWRAERVVYI